MVWFSCNTFISLGPQVKAAPCRTFWHSSVKFFYRVCKLPLIPHSFFFNCWVASCRHGLFFTRRLLVWSKLLPGEKVFQIIYTLWFNPNSLCLSKSVNCLISVTRSVLTWLFAVFPTLPCDVTCSVDFLCLPLAVLNLAQFSPPAFHATQKGVLIFLVFTGAKHSFFGFHLFDWVWRGSFLSLSIIVLVHGLCVPHLTPAVVCPYFFRSLN